SVVYFHNNDPSKDKLLPYGKQGNLVGYGDGSKAYRTFFNGKIIESNSVKIDESRGFDIENYLIISDLKLGENEVPEEHEEPVEAILQHQ
ncbi:hypothetical protein HMI56_003534, partial [Coelomomyces lativittatus]